MISSNLKKILIIGVAIIGFYSIILSFSDLNLVSDQLINFKVEYLPIILALVTLGWFILFARWQILLRNSDITIPQKSSFGIYISGF